MSTRTFVSAASLLAFVAAANGEPNLNCEIGAPITKTFGHAQWLVHGCNNDRTLEFISAPGNPVKAVLLLFWDKGGWSVVDVGNGDTEAARQEIQSLSNAKIMALIAEAKPH